MTISEVNFQRLAAILVILLIVGYLLVAGRIIFVPVAFGIFLAFVLYPLCNFWEQRGIGRPWAISLSFLMVLLLIGGIITLFSSQLISLVNDMSGLEAKFKEMVKGFTRWVEENLQIDVSRDSLEDNLGNFIQTPLAFISNSIRSSTTILANIVLSLIYTFLLLLYRTALKNFWLSQFKETRRGSAADLIKDIQTVVQQYLNGLFIVIIILGILNSTGLWIIGLDYPFFWGFLAAFLAIIPYVGTFIGAFMPFLYSLVTASQTWQPIAVAALFIVVQQLEGNIITPKIIGDNVKINPLAAIFSLIVGGVLWGVAGLILALPMVAVLKVTLENIEPLKPLGALLSSDIYHKDEVFQEKYNRKIHRIFQVFSKKEE